MTHTVEDVLEILAGIKPRMVNVRIDYNEKTLIKSLGRQVFNQTGLTDRQLDLALKKIDKYRDGLIQNSIDVDQVIALKSLRIPLREIDRTQVISLTDNTELRRTEISVKYTFSKKFSATWSEILKKIGINESTEKNIKKLPFTEYNLQVVVDGLRPLNFEVEEKTQEIYEKIEEISINPENFAPYVEMVDGKFEVRNAHKACLDFINSKIPTVDDTNFLAYLDLLKKCGIFHKNREIIEKIENSTANDVVKKSLLATSTRFRINPTTHSMTKVIETINTLDQWPVLVMLDEDINTLSWVKGILADVQQYVDQKDITVFFRLSNGQPNHEEFNQMVKDNHLNNYIGPNTKVVFIAKNRIPKPLFKADWKPNTALVTSAHDYGKTSAYLNDFGAVYYYNNSQAVRFNRIKGSRPIAEL